jgi:hypothetical protein
MGGDAFAAVEQFDGAAGDPYVDLLADQRMRDRIEERLDLDMVVEPDPGDAPFGELVRQDAEISDPVSQVAFEPVAAFSGL